MSLITGKRPSSDSPTTGAAAATNNKKRPKIDSDFDAKFIASSQDDLDIGLLRVQNRRLAERLLQRQRIESELRGRIEQMEKKQLNDDTKLYVINRYWNQLNEDMRLLLQRFDNSPAEATNVPIGNCGVGGGDTDDDDDGINSGKENEETTSFLRQLANCDKEELDEALQQRVLLSTRAVSKVLQAFDRIVQRNEKVMQALKSGGQCSDQQSSSMNNSGDIHDSLDSSKNNMMNNNNNDTGSSSKSALVASLDENVKQLNEELTKENKNLTLLVTSLHEKHHTISLKFAEVNDKAESRELQVDELKNRIDELEFELNKSRTREQRLEDHLYEAREKLRDLQNSGADCSGGSRTDPASTSGGSATGSGGGSAESGLSSGKIDDLRRELEEQRDLAQSRLAELEQLNNEHKETLKFVEKYKMDLQCIPDSVIHESAEYKSLQSHFSVLFNESMQLKTQLEENRTQLTSAKNTHLRQIEQMECEELGRQKQLRNECMQLEDSLAQSRKDFEMLRIEFEQTLAANEQTGPINREMRNLITSLQNHTQQLKGENARIKKKLKESNIEIGRLKAIIEQNGMKVCCGGLLLSSSTSSSSSSTTTNSSSLATAVKLEGTNSGTIPISTMTSSCTSPSAGATCTIDCCTKMRPALGSVPISSSSTVTSGTTMTHHQESAALSSDSSNDVEPTLTIKLEDNLTDDMVVKKEKIETKPFADSSTPPYQNPTGSLLPKKESPNSEAESQSSDPFPGVSFLEQDHLMPASSSCGCSGRSKSDELIRDLKNQLKKSFEAQRELKLLLDMFKSVDKEKREKAHLMGNEKKMKLELEELRMQIKRFQEAERRGDRRKLTDEEYARKIAKFEEVIQQLQKNVAAHKQEEEALLNEMEVTGQAFEDMQEQNLRLMQQLKEKDDANFKLMSERIKSNQIHKFLKEEKEMLTEQIITLQSQVEAQNQVVRKLEEKERILQNNLATVEKEMGLRQQAMDFHKRKAIESSQAAADLKLHLDKYVAQIKDAQSIVADKTSAWQQESFRTKRLHEEVMSYKRKYERAKKFELATTADEVLQEEIRELKEELTCPSCKTKRKDAVLNKCFHVFCYDCLKTRYETRQRKCPKCNQSFSANDFHRLYLA